MSIPFIRCSYVISTEEILPEDITNRLKIVPTDSGLKGEKNKIKGRLPIKNTFWEIEIKENNYEIDVVLGKLLNEIWPKREQVTRLIDDFNCKTIFRILINIEDERAVLSLSAESIKKLAFFDTDLDIDLF